MAENDCRANLIAATTPLFAEKGFNGVGVRELASAAGVNISMISYYFGGKEGLYEAVLSEQFSNLKQLAELMDRETDPMAKFELYVRTTVARYRKHPYLLRFYTSELTNPTSCFETIVKPAIRGVLQILIETFGEGNSQDRFRTGLNPADTVLALAGMVNFYFILEPATAGMVDRAPERDEELVLHIMDILGRGILR
jgi:TetR/AcrR family transcriptional regulator